MTVFVNEHEDGTAPERRQYSNFPRHAYVHSPLRIEFYPILHCTFPLTHYALRNFAFYQYIPHAL